MTQNFRTFIPKIFSFDARFAIWLTWLVCSVRFILVLYANKTANYGFVAAIMMLMAVLPIIFLNKTGLKAIGLIKPKKMWQLFPFFCLGITLSLVMYFIGFELYKHNNHHWFVYIGKSYSLPPEIHGQIKFLLFLIFSFVGSIFSPIGEELFFRGFIHEAFASSFGKIKAIYFESGAFAITHLAHFGLIIENNTWQFLYLPSLLWFCFMFILGLIFNYAKIKLHSIWGAVVCHAGFNIGMTYCIFYLIY